MGPSYRVKLTPQPGFFVVVKICAFCKRRARRPKYIASLRTVETPTIIYYNEQDSNQKMRWRPSHKCSTRQSRRRVDSCCSREHEEVTGWVERTTWTFDRRGLHKNFFLIVFVPSLGKRHWTTIENVIRQCPGQIQVGQFVRSKWRLCDQIFRVVSVDKMPDRVGVTPINGGATLFHKREDLHWVSPILALAYMSA